MKLTVVGSGASAVHFCLSALEAGHEVVVLDVGRQRPEPVRPEDSFEDLKRNLDDPVEHLLGDDFRAVTWPGASGEYYGFPPSKDYVFEGLPGLAQRTSGFAPLASFARGGLAEAWTAGAFPFNEGELADFPFGLDELAPFYDLVARRIGISGADDDLAEHLPLHADLLPPLELDEHSRLLLQRYGERREAIRRDLACVMGRARVATLTREHAGRPACTTLGRCLTGCPTDALYTPLATLRECLAHPCFEYRAGRAVRHFRAERGRVVSVVAERLADGGREELDVEGLVLGAGTLGSARIFLESWQRATGAVERLGGLMDNRQVLMPFVNLAMIRRPHDPETYQYHQLLIGMTADDPRDYVHGQVTTLKSASIHPIVQSVPTDVRTALAIFRELHSALGLVNVNYPDRRRATSWVTLDAPGTLHVHYEPPPDERRRRRGVERRFKKLLRRLGCIVPPGMTHVRPMGSSVHYAGTLPMTAEPGRFTLTPEGRSRDFDNLWVVDGSGFPFLPAKNVTFSLMANAARIAAAI